MVRDFRVCEAGLADAALLASLHQACFGGAHAWEAEAMAGFIADPATLCLLGTAGAETPVGFLIARQAADEAELLTIGTRPQLRRQGAGQQLLRYGIAVLAERGAGRLFLEVDEGNDAAVGLYRALGAKPVGRRLFYYDNGADAAIFSLDLES